MNKILNLIGRTKELFIEDINHHDKELREMINRLQMEQNYERLSQSNISKGMSYVKKFTDNAMTIATLIAVPVTLYNNADKLAKLAGKLK